MAVNGTLVSFGLGALPSSGGGGGTTVVMEQVFNVSDWDVSEVKRLTAGDTAGEFQVALITSDRVPLVLTGQETATFSLRQVGASVNAIDAATATITDPGPFDGIRAIRFAFSTGTPVPAAGDYVATFQVAGLTIPWGRQFKVWVKEAL